MIVMKNISMKKIFWGGVVSYAGVRSGLLQVFLKFFEVFHCHVAEKHYLCAVLTKNALVVELVDTPDLGSGAARRVGSSPIRRT